MATTTKKAQTFHRGLRKQARDLRIGDYHEISGSRDPETIKALHEVCMQRPSPHVHVVTNLTSRCYGFSQGV